MSPTRILLTAFVIVSFLVVPSPSPGQESGRIQGRVVRDGQVGIGGVSIVLNETSQTDITGAGGNFAFRNIPAGTYSLTLVLGQNVLTLSDVAVEAGEVTTIEEVVDWEVGFAETLTVFSASRRLERIVDAPASISTISEQDIESNASHGQVPKLLEFTPGAEVTQSGLYDYNFNTRGFNSSLNRRVVTLIDGRDPAVPFLGAQEWAAISFPLDDLANLELIRGPSAALYGANAFSGVLNMTSKQPRLSQGGLVRITAGELDTANVDFRWAGALGNDWYIKAVGGLRSSGDFSVSRRGAAEYSRPCAPGEAGDCLPQEPVPLSRENDDDIYFGGIRLDKYLNNGSALTFEGGFTDLAGPVFQTGIGRVQLVDVQRPWLRFNFTSDRFNFLTYYNGRKADEQLALSSGSNLALDSNNVMFQGRTNWDFASDKVRVVVGASAEFENIDSEDPTSGQQTLLFEKVDADFQAVFGQVDADLTDTLKLVLAGRIDESSLHEVQASPKASIVYNLSQDHNLRFTYNRAFQVANYSEFFLQANAALPADLTGLNAFCAPFGIDCGFGLTRVVAVGNEDLEVETTQTFELGYSGILAGKAFVTLDYYNSQSKNFITDLIPQLGTSLGRVNPNFGAWEGPAGLPDVIVSRIQQQVPLLTNNFDGSNILAAVSYTNFGNVDSQGIDFGLNYYHDDAWKFSFAYSWFDFTIQEELPGFDTLLLPNSPEHKMSSGITYTRDPFDLSFSLRWVDEFRWGVGPFQGDVEAYTVADLSANYAVTENWKVGVSVSNLFDNEHWQSFGGDLLSRRALVNLTFLWE